MEFVCPACTGPLKQSLDRYDCPACPRSYPVLCGIPDFRLRSDRYLSLGDERAKALRLHEAAGRMSFDELVDFYYSITDDVPAALATRYRAYVRDAPARSRGTLDRLLGGRRGHALLDAGCGSGGLLEAAAGRCDTLVGLDIALRWLVIARKRLSARGVEATLACADVESPPFPPASFSHALAGDLLEHVYDPRGTVASLASLLEPGGRIWLAASNRYCLGPHPLVRLWGVGYVPVRWRSRIVTAIRGVDSLRFTYLTSPGEVADLLRAQGFEGLTVVPREASGTSSRDYPRFDRILIGAYRAACRRRWMRQALVAVGPAFEIVATKGAKGRSTTT